MKSKLRNTYHLIRSFSIYILPKYKKSFKMHWSYKTKNFGDILNPILFRLLTSQEVVPVNSNYYKHINYLMIGSILHHANKDSIVWGSGFISQETTCTEKPLKICAVRGKLTRQKLLEQNIDCPEVYGDPALLMPLVYKPKINKKYKLGIIPHYVDNDNSWLKLLEENDILIINLISDDPLNIIDQINSCEHIASSSLHGLIIADAYEIPSIWISFSNKIAGGHFKFHDYFSSVDKKISTPYLINKTSTVNSLIEKSSFSTLKIDLKKLLNNCPFEISI